MKRVVIVAGQFLRELVVLLATIATIALVAAAGYLLMGEILVP